MLKNVFVTGGAGYVGSALVPRLLEKGHNVKVYDRFIYGDTLTEHSNLKKVNADIRDEEKVRKEIIGADAVIHLACISNDPSFDLDPELGKSINFDAFPNIVECSRDAKVKRFILASSTSQYGIQPVGVKVTEYVKTNPQTDYAKYKLECEKIMQTRNDLVGDMEYVFVRPSTLCGYAPRLRLDLVVNIFTCQALEKKQIKVFNGNNMRAALNINDMVIFYELMLDCPGKIIHGQAFNVSDVSAPIRDLAFLVKNTLGKDIEIVEEQNNDNRSYPVDATKSREVLGFICKYGIENAVLSIKNAYEDGKITGEFDNAIYHNVKRMKEINLK